MKMNLSRPKPDGAGSTMPRTRSKTEEEVRARSPAPAVGSTGVLEEDPALAVSTCEDVASRSHGIQRQARSRGHVAGTTRIPLLATKTLFGIVSSTHFTNFQHVKRMRNQEIPGNLLSHRDSWVTRSSRASTPQIVTQA